MKTIAEHALGYLQKITAKSRVASSRPITLLAAAHFASKAIKKGGYDGLDMLARLQVLEGAAGKPLNAWARNGSKSAVARGLDIAQEYFPDAHPAWFEQGDTGMYKKGLRAAAPILRNHPRMSAEDLMQSMMIGVSMLTGKRVQNVFHSAGQSKAAVVISGKVSPDRFGNLIAKLVARRAKSEVRDDLETQQSQEFVEFGGENIESTMSDVWQDMDQSSKMDFLMLAVRNHTNQDGVAIYEWLKDHAREFPNREQEIASTYLDLISSGSTKGPKAIADQLGVNVAYVSRILKKFYQSAASAAKRDPKIRSIIKDLDIKSYGPQLARLAKVRESRAKKADLKVDFPSSSSKGRRGLDELRKELRMFLRKNRPVLSTDVEKATIAAEVALYDLEAALERAETALYR